MARRRRCDLDRRRLIAGLALGLAALALSLSRINAHGLWFDEAYTARIAALSPERVLRGALADIHPPGWPLLSALTLRLPLAPEVALRLPSALAFAALVGWVASRRPLLGLALLGAAPLVDQATQGRPYMLLAAGLVLCSQLLEARRWGLGGLAAGAVASLHALGAALVAPVLVVQVVRGQATARDLAQLALGGLVLVAPWAPAFASRAVGYLGAPWYAPGGPGAWWTVTDGWAGALGLLVWLATRGRDGWMRALPGLAVLAMLVALELAGVGVEIRKVGVVVLPLLLAGAAPGPQGRRAWAGGLALVAGLFLSDVRQDDRPDLREAASAVRALGSDTPVMAVFASEAAWTIRTPAPLPSRRDPDGIRERLIEVLDATGRPCVAALSLPGTFPGEDTLPPGIRTVATALVTGLDVRLVGDVRCAAPVDAVGWTPAK